MTVDLYKMASAEFLEQALSTDVDENAVNAIVGSLENQLVKTVSSKTAQNIILNELPTHIGNISSGNSIGVQKYNTNQISGSVVSGIQSTGVLNSVSFSDVQAGIPSSFITQNLTAVSNSTAPQKVIFSQTQTLDSNHSPRGLYAQQPISNGQILHGVIPQTVNKSIAMQTPLVLKQSTNSGQVGMQPGMVTVPMTVNSSMAGSIPNVMAINKPGGQNVVVTTQNLGSAQPTILPNVQILNMRPGAPAVAAQKSVAAVSPRVVIGAPQVVGTRAAAPGITLQTLQSLQPGQQGHLLLKTETGQYQLLRVGPAPAAGTLTAPQPQTIRLSTVPAHPGVATVSTSIASPGPLGPMPTGPIAAPVLPSPLPSVSSPTLPLQPQPPTVTTQKPNDNTKEKCRNFLANLLDLSSKEPKSVEKSVRNLIQELIDALVEPEEFCDRLERLLNASPQPCLIGFLKRSLPLLRQSLVTKELVIEGINPPSPHLAFSPIPVASQPIMANTNVQMLCDEGGSNLQTQLLLPLMQVPTAAPILLSPNHINAIPVPTTIQLRDEESSSPTLTPLLPPVLPGNPLLPQIVPPQKPINVMSMQSPSSTQPPPQKPGNIAVLQNIPVHTKINMNKVGGSKSMTVNSKGNFPRAGMPSAALSTVLNPGKSLLKDKEKKSMQFSSQPFTDDKMTGDDDINDVAAMGGVNLAEESQRILGSTELIGTQIRSCKEEYLIPMGIMQARVKAISARHGLEEPSPDVAAILIHAVHERLKTLIEKLAVIAQHRIDLVIKSDSRYEVTQDVKGQLKFLEELDRADKKRREDSEREILLRAAKSRSKNEDPEQAKLKAKAKEMQRAELEELRQREANLTALQAIGPRKKPRLDGPGGSGDAISTGPLSSIGFPGRSQLALRTRLKRINLRDMLFLMEQERDTAHSTLLYRSYLK